MFEFKFDVNMTEFLKEAHNLLLEHWEELALNKETIPYKPDVTKYQALQDVGVLKNIVVYKEDKVIGYSVIFIQPHLHYSDNGFAYVDVIYVDKEYRGTSAGARLLLETENIAKKAGASVITHHVKPYVPMIIKPLQKLGYTLYEEIYGKYLEVK